MSSKSVQTPDRARKTCRRCTQVADLRCSQCRIKYCGRPCQSKDWGRHVFVCVVPQRPNDVDRLRWYTRCWRKSDESRSKILKALYADDSICKSFGFNSCVDKKEVSCLICIYGNFITKVQPTKIQGLLERGRLSEYIEHFISIQIEQVSVEDKGCSCFPWYLERRKSGFDIPNLDEGYHYQALGAWAMEEAFSMTIGDEAWGKMSKTEHSVANLFSILMRDFNNIPDVSSSEWLRFRFCYCKTDTEKQDLANSYLGLIEQQIPLREIATAWDSKALWMLMENNDIDLTSLDHRNIQLHELPGSELGIYRLMLEVNHAISGQFCNCYTPDCEAHSKYETHFSKETSGDYGFHGTNSWERWRLLNFYRYVFTRPSFDPVEMQKAKRSEDKGSLERYLDSLVPGFRRKMMDIHRADGMFPNLSTRVAFPEGRTDCSCHIHDVYTSEGLDWLNQEKISQLQQRLAKSRETME